MILRGELLSENNARGTFLVDRLPVEPLPTSSVNYLLTRVTACGSTEPRLGFGSLPYGLFFVFI